MNPGTQTIEKDTAMKAGANNIPTEGVHPSNPISRTPPMTRNGSKPNQKNNPQKASAGNNPLMQKNQKASSQKHLVNIPALIEFSITISWAILVTISVLICLISYKSGVKGLEFFLRTGSAVFLSGTLLVLFNWMVAQGSYEIHQDKLEKEKRERESEELFMMEMDPTEIDDANDMSDESNEPEIDEAKIDGKVMENEL